ncbi:MAG: hypothetical protein D6785_11705 [Planctomycetota bacterium]|nr:MAG: hypothetical protein D6785_11705 [Planctomycetota bacterium]
MVSLLVLLLALQAIGQSKRKKIILKIMKIKISILQALAHLRRTPRILLLAILETALGRVVPHHRKTRISQRNKSFIKKQRLFIMKLKPSKRRGN